MSPMLRALSLTLLISIFLVGCASLGSSRVSSEDAETANRYVEIGFRHLEFDNAQQARRSFREAMALNPRSSGGHLGMALVYQREGEPELAEDYFQRAMSLGDDTQYVHLYGQFLFRQGRFEEAKEQITQATNDPDYVQRGAAFEDLAIINLYERDMEAAKRHFDRAIQLNRMLPMPYWHMTNIYMQEGDTSRAMEYYEGFENLVNAEVMDHTEESLILGLRVSQAVEREETYSGLLEILQQQYPESRYLRDLE